VTNVAGAREPERLSEFGALLRSCRTIFMSMFEHGFMSPAPPGLSPAAAVTGSVRDAIAVAEGDIPDLDALQVKIEAAEENAERYGQGDPEAIAEFMKVRLTTADGLLTHLGIPAGTTFRCERRY
jgi:hypothetical protein